MSEPQSMFYPYGDNAVEYVERSAYDQLKAKCDAYQLALERIATAYKRMMSDDKSELDYSSCSMELIAREVLEKYKGDT